MARTVIGDILFAETLYFPAANIREFAHVQRWQGSEFPEVGYVPVTIFPVTEEDFGNGYDEVNVANYRALVEDFGTYGDGNGGRLVTIGYGMSEGLGFIGRDDSTELGEIARQLAHEYPLYDEEAHSALSWERQHEYLEDGGVWDFRRETGDTWETCEDETIVSALLQAVTEHDFGGDWDGSGYGAWDEIVEHAAAILRGDA